MESKSYYLLRLIHKDVLFLGGFDLLNFFLNNREYPDTQLTQVNLLKLNPKNILVSAIVDLYISRLPN